MIVSIAIAVLPVWRSPMISSRWPRPIGIIESIALSPVCSGSLTPWRWTTPGALNSAGRVSEVLMSPLSSSGRPSGSTRRPSSSSPTGISQQLAGALDGVALDDLLPVAEQHGADVVLLEVQREADDVVGQLEHLERHAVVEAVDARDPVADLEHGADLGEVGLAGVHPLDPVLEDVCDLVGLDFHLVSVLLPTPPARRSFEVFPGGCACSRRAPCSRPAATRPPRISSSTLLESSTVWPVCFSISLADPLDDPRVELDRAGHRDLEALVLLRPELLELARGCGTSPASGASRRAARGS